MRLGALLCLIAFFVGEASCTEAPDPPATLVKRIAEGASHDESDPPLLVYISDEGLTRVGGEELLDDASILAHARDYQAAHPRGLAVVRCAPAAIHGRAIRVVQLLEEARIPSVAIDRVK